MQEKYQKKVYQQKMRAYLTELRAELDEIEAQLSRPDVALEDETAARTLERAEQVDQAAREQLQTVEETESPGWEERRAHLEAAWDNLRSKLEHLATQIDKPEDRTEETTER